MTASYPRKVRQANSAPHSAEGAAEARHGMAASNVRPASPSLLTNRMDALSFQMARLSCSGLE